MGDLRPDETSHRQPGKPAQKAARTGGKGAAAPASRAPGVPSGVRTALGQLREAAAAHDDELPAPGLPRAAEPRCRRPG